MFATATALFLLLTLLAVLALLTLMRRPAGVRPMTVWALAALLPVLAAMTAANAGQARAQRTLSTYEAQPVQVALHTAGGTYSAQLSANDAACLERALRLHTEYDLHIPGAVIPIRKNTTASGPLPSRAVVDALSIRGTLNCSNFRATAPK